MSNPVQTARPLPVAGVIDVSLVDAAGNKIKLQRIAEGSYMAESAHFSDEQIEQLRQSLYQAQQEALEKMRQKYRPYRPRPTAPLDEWEIRAAW